MRIWDISDDEPVNVKTIRVVERIAHGGPQRFRIAWQPGSGVLAVPFAGGVHLLARGTWEVSKMLVGGHSKEVSLVSWSANGLYLASAGVDRQVYVWQLSSSEDIDRHKAER